MKQIENAVIVPLNEEQTASIYGGWWQWIIGGIAYSLLDDFTGCCESFKEGWNDARK